MTNIEAAHAKAQRGQGREEKSHAQAQSSPSQEGFLSLANFASWREDSSLRPSPPSRPLRELLFSSPATPSPSVRASESATAQDKNPVLHSTTGHWPLVTILIAFLLLGLAYSAINPLHEATDELRHYRFIQHLIQRRALPAPAEPTRLA